MDRHTAANRKMWQAIRKRRNRLLRQSDVVEQKKMMRNNFCRSIIIAVFKNHKSDLESRCLARLVARKQKYKAFGISESTAWRRNLPECKLRIIKDNINTRDKRNRKNAHNRLVNDFYTCIRNPNMYRFVEDLAARFKVFCGIDLLKRQARHADLLKKLNPQEIKARKLRANFLQRKRPKQKIYRAPGYDAERNSIRRENLSDVYVRGQITRRSTLSHADIPPAMVDLKRIQIRMRRAIRATKT